MPNISVDYLVVAGGGGGGADMGGGGGGGGVLASSGLTVVTGTTYSVAVGAGGTGAPAGTTVARGNNGTNSTISTNPIVVDVVDFCH